MPPSRSLAASVFFNTGRTDVGEIRQAHELLSPMLGSTIVLYPVCHCADRSRPELNGNGVH